jgi:hypothetical protein
MRALVLGVATLTLSAGVASAQAVYPSQGDGPYGYGYTATAPLYYYAGPASATPHGYGPLNSCLPSAAVGARLLHSAVSPGFAAVI